MVEIGSQKAALSDCRSLGSSQYPSGRFPKVSIGITTDKCSKTGYGLRKDAASLPAGGKTLSCQGAEETTRTGIVETSERNRLEDAVENHKASAWFSTRFERSAHDETQNAETVKFFKNSASVLQSEIGVHRNFDAVAYGKIREKGRNVQRVEEVAFATVQETHVVDKGNVREEREKTAKFNEKRLNSITYRNKREKSVDVERAEDIAFSTKQLVGEQNIKEPEEMAKCNNDVLKMKLWEILGTVPSDNKHTMNSNDMEYKEGINVNQNGENPKGNVAGTKLNSPDLEQNKENLSINQSREYKKGKAARGKLNSLVFDNKENLNIKQRTEFHKRKAARAKQNSDTIETDSESPNEVTRRPVTRSLTQKKAPAKRVQNLQGSVSYGKKPLSSSSSDFKLKLEKKNIFAFDEAEAKARSLCGTSSGNSNRSKEKIDNQNKDKIEPRRIHFPRSMEDKSLYNSDREQSSLSPDKASPKSKEKGNSSVPCQGKNKFLQTVDGTPNDSHHSQEAGQLNFDSPLWAYKQETRESTGSPLLKMKKHSWDHENSPPESKNASMHAAAACRSMGRKNDESGDFQSPTFAEDMSPTSRSMAHNEVLTSPAAAGCSKSIQKNYSSKDLDNSTPGSCQAGADSEASDDTKETHKLGELESPFMKDEEPEKQQFSLSPVEERDTESEADDLTIQGFGLTNKWFSNTGSPENSPLSLHRTKRVRSLNNIKLSKANLASRSPIGTSRTEETVGSLEALEQYPEGSLARCVAQLALVLGRFKTRMKLQISKRSSEILSGAADKIRQQLQDVESQILADVGKFYNIGKSKRKRLETRFQEKQERLQLIHVKFKEEVNQHLLDCRSILEELEAYNLELKGTADWQKASRRKLLLQAEEVMETEINEAESSIAVIHKDARKKMVDLKHALKEWMH